MFISRRRKLARVMDVKSSFRQFATDAAADNDMLKWRVREIDFKRERSVIGHAYLVGTAYTSQGTKGGYVMLHRLAARSLGLLFLRTVEAVDQAAWSKEKQEVDVSSSESHFMVAKATFPGRRPTVLDLYAAAQGVGEERKGYALRTTNCMFHGAAILSILKSEYDGVVLWTAKKETVVGNERLLRWAGQTSADTLHPVVTTVRGRFPEFRGAFRKIMGDVQAHFNEKVR
jgi:hypothetical protein